MRRGGVEITSGCVAAGSLRVLEGTERSGAAAEAAAVERADDVPTHGT